MTDYRLYMVGNDGHFIGSFTADSDDDAVLWVKQQIEDRPMSFGVVRGL